MKAHLIIDRYLEAFDSASTKRAYKADLIEWVDLVQPADLETVRPEEFRSIIGSSSFANAKPATIRRKVASLNGFLKWLQEGGVSTATQPGVISVRADSVPIKTGSSSLTLTVAQYRSLLETAKSAGGNDAVRNHALIYTMLTVPIRRAPLASIDVSNLSLTGNVPYLICASSRGQLPLRFSLPIESCSVLVNHIEHYGIASGPLWRSHSRRNPGGRLTPTSIYRIVRDTAMAAGLPEIGAHTLRHTGCTLAIDNGATLQQVQSHARHKQIETTMVYVHQRDRLRDSAADFIKLDEPDRS